MSLCYALWANGRFREIVTLNNVSSSLVFLKEELSSGLSVVETVHDEGGKSFQLLETVDFC